MGIKDAYGYLFFESLKTICWVRDALFDSLCKISLIPYPIKVCWHFNRRKEEEKGNYNNGIWMQKSR